MLGDHHQWGKMSYRNAAFHVPLIIRSPAHRAQFGHRVEAITESVDLAPTILDLIGQDIPDTMDGQSLRPFLEGQSPAGWRNHSFSELSYGDPLTPTRWQRDLGLAAEEAPERALGYLEALLEEDAEDAYREAVGKKPRRRSLHR